MKPRTWGPIEARLGSSLPRPTATTFASPEPSPRRDAFDVAQEVLAEADAWLGGTAAVARPAADVVESVVDALRDVLAAHERARIEREAEQARRDELAGVPG